MQPTPRSGHGRHQSDSRLREETGWLDQLPVEWRPMVVAPVSFVCHREYEIAANRTLGYDPDQQVCYYVHRYIFAEPRSDNDEDFYPVVTRGETLRAWRLRDDRWLTYRVVLANEEGGAGRGFYSFSATCPR